MLVKPTATQTDDKDRVRMVELRKQGWTDRAMAQRIGCSVWTVIRWVKAFARGGWDAWAYPSCAPKTSHPLPTPEAVRQRIREI
ncbi:helix-turn-helix domain-containing protein [Thermoflexus sp.]|uniref:helix-turn-helix domain-containing protein n=1 Tax=Thermoflexus sp. TaxID=1969742 RepID=UPI0035E41D58